MDKDCLEKVQIRMVNMISGLSGKSYDEKLAEIRLESLANRRIEYDICMAHKLLHGVGDFEPDIWFDKIPLGQVTRANADPLNIRPQKGNLDLRKHFFSNRVINEWNKLPFDVKSICSPNKFKIALRKWRKGVSYQIQEEK
jgi:hypothetical protein